MLFDSRVLKLLVFSGLLSVPTAIYAQFTAAKFAFGVKKAPKGFVLISDTTEFGEKSNYGFDLNTKPQIVKNGNEAKVGGSTATSETPFYFSINVPEGNYRVTVTLGNSKQESLTTVKAESRRLMLEHVKTKKDELKTLSFIVNVRKPAISTGGHVKLKDREVGKLDWDDKLTLEFSDKNPCVSAIEIDKVEDQITVFLAGNSTVVDQGEEPWASWGQMIPRFFKPGVAIANHAESGLTLKSFLGSNRLDKVISQMKPGDYLFIEFGHNDQKENGGNDGAYKGYTERLKTFIKRVKAAKGIPVVVTSTARRSFDGSGKTVNTLGDFPAAARKAAQEEGVALIDLNVMSTLFYDAMGVEPSKKAFVHYPANTFPGQDKALADNTHFNTYGAYELAKCILLGIKANKLGIEKYIIDLGDYDPSKPDPESSFYCPQSLSMSIVKPEGN